MKILVRILVVFLSFFTMPEIFAQFEPVVNIVDDMKTTENINVTEKNLSPLSDFLGNFNNFFIASDRVSIDGTQAVFYNIAHGMKNFFILVAVIFLMIGIINLLFSDADDAAVSKWKNNILWTSVGIVFLQMVFAIWQMLWLDSIGVPTDTVNSTFGWKFWDAIMAPIVQLMHYGAGFIFVFMMFYAFYMMLIGSGSGDDNQVSRGITTFIFALIGFGLLQLPFRIVGLLYANIPDCTGSKTVTLWNYAGGACAAETEVQTEGIVEFFTTLLKYVNGFLTIICVALVLYAGFLVLTSRGDEGQLTKAKNTIIYIAIGFILLIVSHALIRFFLLQTPA